MSLNYSKRCSLNAIDFCLVFLSNKLIPKVCKKKGKDVTLLKEATLVHAFAEKIERRTLHQSVIDIEEGSALHICASAGRQINSPLEVIVDSNEIEGLLARLCLAHDINSACPPPRRST
jgi:hypothetical protein